MKYPSTQLLLLKYFGAIPALPARSEKETLESKKQGIILPQTNKAGNATCPVKYMAEWSFDQL